MTRYMLYTEKSSKTAGNLWQGARSNRCTKTLNADAWRTSCILRDRHAQL